MIADEVARGLPKISRRIFQAVRDAGSEGISWSDIKNKVYADDPNGGPFSNSVSVLINRVINPRIRHHGLQLSSRGGPGSVYRLQRIKR